jgi:hypothetical protein
MKGKYCIVILHLTLYSLSFGAVSPFFFPTSTWTKADPSLPKSIPAMDVGLSNSKTMTAESSPTDLHFQLFGSPFSNRFEAGYFCELINFNRDHGSKKVILLFTGSSELKEKTFLGCIIGISKIE